MRKLKLVTGVLLVFSAGLLVGAFGTGYGIRCFVNRIKTDSKFRINVLLGSLTHELALKKEQKKPIQTILIKTDKEIDLFWNKILKEIEYKVNQAREDIKKELDSDQVVRFEKFINRLKGRPGGYSYYFITPAPINQTP